MQSPGAIANPMTAVYTSGSDDEGDGSGEGEGDSSGSGGGDGEGDSSSCSILLHASLGPPGTHICASSKITLVVYNL